MNANDTQVAGTHYRSSHQHWDLAASLHLGYFEGQISKYVTRHRGKKGKEDLEKALHFAQKLLELARNNGQKPQRMFPTGMQMEHYVKANCLNLREHVLLKTLLNWSTVHDLENVVHFLSALITSEYGEGPGPSYVNQG